MAVSVAVTAVVVTTPVVVVLVFIAATDDGQSSITTCGSICLLTVTAGVATTCAICAICCALIGSSRQGLRATRRRSAGESVLRHFL